MKALLLTEYRRLELADLPTPTIAADEVLVRVRACGVCGSDVHGFDGSTGRRIPPLVMGHEAAGIVEEVGGAVRNFRPGDRVTFDSTVSCGSCEYCRAGRINLCERREVLGVSCGDYRRHGAFAEFVAVPERIVYRLPDAVAMEHAALIEAVSVAVHAVAITPIKPDSDVAVIGAGMIGLLVIQALRNAGCGRILAVDVDEGRLELARQHGADATFSKHAASELRNATAGRGVDAALEVVGKSETIATAIEGLCKGGDLTLVGNLSPRVEIPLQIIVNREITLRGSCASNGEYPECIALMTAGAIDVRPLISACVPLAEGPDWFNRLYNREPNLMKVILQP